MGTTCISWSFSTISCLSFLGDKMEEQKRNLKHSIIIFIAILAGIAAFFVKPADPALASMRSASPVLPAPVTFVKGAGPCGDKSKRYFDCGNGTVTDTLTGLIWLKKAYCLPEANWEDAKKAVAA